MAILTYPLNGVLYDAEDVETYLCTRTSGVFASDGHFPASVTGQREVTIGPGLAWMNNEEFHGKAIYNPENVALTIAEADAYQTRIDRIVLRFDKLLNMTTLTVLQGTPASSPQPPAITRDSLTYDLGLYTVTVRNSTASISASDVASTMLDESVCGIMEDAVTSIPTQELYDQWYAWFASMQADTETMENQFNLWFEQLKEDADQYMTDTKNSFEVWMNGEKVDFDTWFDSIQDTLDGDTAGKLANLVNDAQDTADEALEQLMTGVVTGFMSEQYEGGEYGLLADDSDETHGITLSKNICDCEGNPSANADMISDEFNESHVYSEGDYCIYEDTLFVFAADKSAGAWDWECVKQTNVGTELSSQGLEIETEITEVKSNIPEIRTGWVDMTNATIPASGSLYLSIEFTEPMTFSGHSSEAPIVLCTISRGASSTGYGSIQFLVMDRGRTGFNVRIINASSDSSLTPSFNWIAIEPMNYQGYVASSGGTITPSSIDGDDDGDTKVAPGPEIIDPDDDGNDEPDDDDTKTAPGPEIIEPDDDEPDDGDDDGDGTVVGPGPEEVE